MSEAAPENGPQDDAPARKPQEGAEQEPKTYDAEYVSNLRKEAAKYRTEAKAKDAELEKQRQASMTEAERAVAEAEARGRLAATTEYGKELARSRFDALAGRRNPDFDTAQALEFVDLGRFVGDDGRPDETAISAAVQRLIPEGTAKPPSFDTGTRNNAATGDMNFLIRKAAGHG